MYSAVSEFRQANCIEVSSTNLPFFNYFVPNISVKSGQKYSTGSSQFNGLINGMLGWGDAFMRRIKYDAPAQGHLNEEYNRNTGDAQGAADLTWSYAALLTAALARAQVSGDSGYAAQLANLAI